MDSYTDTSGQAYPERRRNPRLRAIFDDASQRIERFFKAVQPWAGSSLDHLALRLVHEAYPDLSGPEVRLLVNAIERGRQASAA